MRLCPSLVSGIARSRLKTTALGGHALLEEGVDARVGCGAVL